MECTGYSLLIAAPAVVYTTYATTTSHSAGGQASLSGVDARFAASAALLASTVDQQAEPHWVRHSGSFGAVITAEGMILLRSFPPFFKA